MTGKTSAGGPDAIRCVSGGSTRSTPRRSSAKSDLVSGRARMSLLRGRRLGSYHPPPTPPHGRTWAPVVGDGRREGRTQNRPTSTHTPPRPCLYATRDLGRAVSGHAAALVHLAPAVPVGAEGLEPWCLSGTPGAIRSPCHDRCALMASLKQ